MRSEEKEKFLSRWSRRKQEAREQPENEPVPAPAVDPKSPPPELPPVDKLTMESDFRGFFHPKVDENLRRTALKKLFSDPHFNVMDGLDVYIDDYSKPSPMPAEMLASLKQAQNILAWAKDKGDGQQKDAADGRADTAAGAAQLTDEAVQEPSHLAAAPASPQAVVPGEETQQDPQASDRPAQERHES